VPLRARSIIGLMPLTAVNTLGPATMARLPAFMRRAEWFTGAGLGASHQTGWTGLVADLIVKRGRWTRRPARSHLTSAPFGRTTSQRPPNSETFWQRICRGERSPT
jgi:hypothetical protein